MKSEIESHPAASSEGTPDAPQQRRFLDRTRKTVRFLSRLDDWKKHYAHVAHRATFPLARKVIANEQTGYRTLIDVSTLPMTTLRKTQRGQRVLAAVFSALLFWAVITTTKGVMAIIKFDAWLTPWTVTGVPMLMFATVRLCIYLKVLRVVGQEIEEREATKHEGAR